MQLTPRRPRHNDTPLLQRRPLRQVRHQIRAIKQKVRNSFILSHLSINGCTEVQGARVSDRRRRNETRAHGSEGVESFREPPLWHGARERGISLELSGRYIVTSGVGCDVGKSSFGGDVFGVFANDQALGADVGGQ